MEVYAFGSYEKNSSLQLNLYQQVSIFSQKGSLAFFLFSHMQDRRKAVVCNHKIIYSVLQISIRCLHEAFGNWDLGFTFKYCFTVELPVYFSSSQLGFFCFEGKLLFLVI